MASDDVSRLRNRVTEVTAHPARPDQCQELWSRLIRHELKITLRFANEQRECLVLREHEGSAPLEGRNLLILERFLLGDERKAIGMDLGLSTSTIAQILKVTLSRMGLDCAPIRAPSQLVLLLHRSRGHLSEAALMLVELEDEGERYWVLSEDVDRPLLKALAPAQQAVLMQLIRGRSYGDIAAQRRTAYRTVANQIASACQRLGVSGRSQLLQLIAASRATPAR